MEENEENEFDPVSGVSDQREEKSSVSETRENGGNEETEFDRDGFLDWLDKQDTYYIADKRVRQVWPDFYDHYELTGVTIKMNSNGASMVPIRDYRDVVIRGYPLD